MRRWWFAGSSYIHYLWKAKSRYVIHSPFVFDLINHVFINKTKTPELIELDKACKAIFNRTTIIETTDLGAGAGKKTYVTLVQKLGKIARKRTQEKKYRHLLYYLTQYFQPESILEFGTSVGISASYIGKGCAFKKFVTMEGCAVLAAHAKETFIEQELPDITVKTGNFDNILDKVLNEFTRLDLVFFDGNHRKEATISYFERCLPKSHEDSIFIFDDIHWSPEMSEAWEYVKNSSEVSISIDLYKMGILFFKKGIARQNFIIRY